MQEDLRALGGDQNWVEAAQDRERWRVYVAAASSLHGSRPPECVSVILLAIVIRYNAI